MSNGFLNFHIWHRVQFEHPFGLNELGTKVWLAIAKSVTCKSSTTCMQIFQGEDLLWRLNQFQQYFWMRVGSRNYYYTCELECIISAGKIGRICFFCTREATIQIQVEFIKVYIVCIYTSFRMCVIILMRCTNNKLTLYMYFFFLCSNWYTTTLHICINYKEKDRKNLIQLLNTWIRKLVNVEN
jgi:hypothetical protein